MQSVVLLLTKCDMQNSIYELTMDIRPGSVGFYNELNNIVFLFFFLLSSFSLVFFFKKQRQGEEEKNYTSIL